MKIKFLSFFALSALLVLLPACVSTPEGQDTVGVPLVKDRIVSRYARPVAQLAAATRMVLNRNGKMLVDNSVNNSFVAKVNQRTVRVKVTDVDGKLTEVVVQARGDWGGDVQLAAGISTQIAMQLEATPAP
ncbi:MAG TPA: hypothetical protein VFC44_17770 [Candidatus Saccharimonadales bacterium]|nr:hypothetical protein [Candidatus Saccharimonadales bacterium]